MRAPDYLGVAKAMGGVMEPLAALILRRNRGWAWPEDSFGLTPMYGEDGWCQACGVPQRPQSGNLVLQRKGFAQVRGAWAPNWRYDMICLEKGTAERIAQDHAIDLRPVSWPRTSPGEAMQDRDTYQPQPMVRPRRTPCGSGTCQPC